MIKKLAKAAALESLAMSVLAVAAEATPVPVGIPLMTGVAIVGVVPKTSAPDPVSSVTAVIRLALDGVARKVAIPVPRPLTPVLIGNPVQLVRTPADGVPIFGVTRTGEVEKTTFVLVVPVVPVAAFR